MVSHMVSSMVSHTARSHTAPPRGTRRRRGTRRATRRRATRRQVGNGRAVLCYRRLLPGSVLVLLRVRLSLALLLLLLRPLAAQGMAATRQPMEAGTEAAPAA